MSNMKIAFVVLSLLAALISLQNVEAWPLPESFYTAMSNLNVAMQKLNQDLANITITVPNITYYTSPYVYFSYPYPQTILIGK